MRARYRRLLAYLKEQGREASTWRGLVLLLTACGANLSPEQREAVITAGLGIAGLIGVVFPDRKKARSRADSRPDDLPAKSE